LDEVPLAGERVDRCRSCQGIFFDYGELGSLVRMVRLFREAQIDEPDLDLVPDREHGRAVPCPADGAAMAPDDIGGVVVDICPACRGLWLDGGELAALKIAEAGIRAHLGLYRRLGS
jgi:hypothetical protein